MTWSAEACMARISLPSCPGRFRISRTSLYSNPRLLSKAGETTLVWAAAMVEDRMINSADRVKSVSLDAPPMSCLQSGRRPVCLCVKFLHRVFHSCQDPFQLFHGIRFDDRSDEAEVVKVGDDGIKG